MKAVTNGRKATETAPEDDSLILAVAQIADRDAYATLYERYKDAAFNLALKITGSPVLAEDAVQEALLRIWVSARSYVPGNARGWILRIVARESLQKLNAKKRGQTKSYQEHEIYKQFYHSSQGDNELERSETLKALGSLLKQLSTEEQQLVALHFGTGLSLRAMSAELAVPHQTLHRQIKSVLNTLKSRLSDFAPVHQRQC